MTPTRTPYANLTMNDRIVGTRVSRLIGRLDMKATDDAPAWGVFQGSLAESIAETRDLQSDAVWRRKIGRSRMQTAVGRTHTLDEYLDHK